MTPRRHLPGGLFVTFEGCECSGKSTQLELLKSNLLGRGFDVLSTREPGGTVVGEKLREMVKHMVGDEEVCDEAELFIFSASRAQLTRKVILPHLARGGIVLCDRYHDSTTAYQGYARGFDIDYIRGLHRVATCGRLPDLTLLLDLPVALQEQRGQLRLSTLNLADRFDDAERGFHERVRHGYLCIAHEEPERVQVIDAAAERDHVQTRILEAVDARLARVC